jgi:beta-glucosidase
MAVGRVLRLVDAALPALGEPVEVDEDAHHALARRAAQQSAVLLRNDGGTLPLRPTPGATVAVLGAFARDPRFQGAGSSRVRPTRVDVPLDELTTALGPDVTVRFAQGFDTMRDDPEADAALRDEAVALARDADHVVVFVGLPASSESEGFDRADLDLPATQRALLDAVAAVHDRVVVVLANGSAVRMSPWDQQVAAILECWLSGQAAGGAAADLLVGTANPCGRLAETIPLRLEDTPSYLHFPGGEGVARYGEGVFVGYRGHDARDQPVSYPFGFGLSYTTFAMTDVGVSVGGSVADGNLDVKVTATVTNTGDVAGAEVVQVYVGDVEAAVARPPRELKGAARVELAPGERQTVTVPLDWRAFAFWSVRWHRWVVEAGEFTIGVGSSSRDLAAVETVRLDAPSLAAPLTGDSTLHEWLADPAGRRLLADASPREGPPIDDEMLAMVGSMPMHTLAAFPGTGFDVNALDRWVAQLATDLADHADHAGGEK